MQRTLTLKEARDARGWSQEELEAATAALAASEPHRYGVCDQQNISKIERGRIVDPRNKTVAALETALGLRRGTLVFGVRREAIAS